MIMIITSCTFIDHASACGGIFCDNNLPVNQAAERILFAYDEAEGRMHMHVQITYQGPPDDFSWLLPVPPATEFGLSRPALFAALDSRYTPTFMLNRISADYCPRDARSNSGAIFESSLANDDTEEQAGVQVTSQNQVGPYDQVTLRADNVATLIEWLNDNQYQVPPNAEETLAPYIGAYEFLAIKLSSGQESGDIQPVALRFIGDVATIPLRPTAVASEPDMGVIVHLLGAARGVPTNYQLVELNLAALNWFNPTDHYAQLVSHAVDEAENGQGFVTDFAGPHRLPIDEVTPLVSPNLVLAMEEVRDSESLYEVLILLLSTTNQPDLNQVLLSSLPLNRADNQRLIDLARTEQTVSSVEVAALIYDEEGAPLDADGASISQNLVIYNRGGQDLQRLFSINTYMTRLYTTLNASEMTVDPSFDFNPDLIEVPQARVADLYLDCDGNRDYLITPEGYEVDLSGEPVEEQIERQNGETIRGTEVIGAAVILRSMSAGQPEVISDQRESLSELYRRPTVDRGGFLGCQQRSSDKGTPVLPILSLLLASLALVTSSWRSQYSSKI